MRINVLFLGPARDFAGVESLTQDLPDGATVADLRDRLMEERPGLRGAMGTIRFAVNEEFAREETTLHSGDEVALVPPVSGGTSDADVYVELVRAPIAADRVRSFVTGDPRYGAIVTFEGATREETHAEHGKLVRLDYEGYDSMARRQLEHLATETRQRFGAGRVAVVHRLGRVLPGEASVMMAVACPHRAEAFEACRFLIDTLKKDVPIWKKDVFENGAVRWVEVGRKGRREEGTKGRRES